jgi:hypothetical protein
VNLKARLSRLESSTQPLDNAVWHRVIGNSAKECEAQRQAMIKAGDAEKSDRFIFRIII